MARVVTKGCLGSKDKSCVEVCPVDCFYDIRKKKYNVQFGVEVEGEDGDPQIGMLMIHPDECIDCGACETECPEDAIMEDSEVPDDMQAFIEINSQETTSLSDEELDELRCTEKD